MNLAFPFSLSTRAACCGPKLKLAEVTAFILLKLTSEDIGMKQKHLEKDDFKLSAGSTHFLSRSAFYLLVAWQDCSSRRYDLCYGEGDGYRERSLKSF